MKLPHLIGFQDKDVPSRYKNSRWGFLDWSWITPHLPEDLHEDSELFEGFLNWMDRQVSGLSKQVYLHKNQLQELLLGLALAIRDARLACITDHEETPLPPFLLESHLDEDDLQKVGALVDAIFQVIDDHIKWVGFSNCVIKTHKKKQWT